MSLTITQGPLPNDFDRVDASTFLESWVAGTSIVGLDIGSFASSISLVASSTDVPANNIQRLGLFWFKRGEGQLYVLEEADRCDDRYTIRNDVFVPIAPARAFLVEVQKGGVPGGVATLGEVDVPATDLESYFEDCKGRRIPFYRANPTGMDSANRLGYYTGIITGTSGSLLPSTVYEWGFVQGIIATGGSNIVRGAFAKQYYDATGLDAQYLQPRAVAWTGETNYANIGIIVDTNATTNSHLALIFKRPGLDYGWHSNY